MTTAAVVGGTGVGKALHLARLGIGTQLHTFTGDGALGATDRETLEGVGVQLITATAPAAIGETLRSADLVFVDLTEHTRQVLPQLRESGARLWVDLHHWDGEPSDFHAPFIEAASHVFVSDIALDNPLRTAEQLVPGKELVVLTHGKRGATAFFPDSEPFFVLPYVAGPVVDTVGAGDAFCTGTAYGRLRGWDWPRALRAGAVVAGKCVTVPEPADPDLTPGWLESRI